MVLSDISLSKVRTNPVGMSPWCREIPKLYHSSWVPVGFLGVSRGSTHGEENNKCIIHRTKNTNSDLHRAAVAQWYPILIIGEHSQILYYNPLLEAI